MRTRHLLAPKQHSSVGTGLARAAKLEMLGKDLEAQEELQQEDVLDVSERFEILSDLGGGAYGMVYKARDKGRGGEVVAVKRVRVREDPEIGIPPFLMREVANLKRLSAQSDRRDLHIVRLLDVTSVDGRYEHELIFHLVFEYMDLDLDQFITRCPPPGMNEEVVKDFLGQILSGVDWMHVNNIIHRDIKPQNILVSRDGRKIKIADFGLSRLIGSNVVLSTQVVTQWYRAPEVLLHSSYCKAVDMWSVGCVFAEMIRGRPLFAAMKGGEKPQLEEIFSIIGTPTKEQWPLETSLTLDQFVPYSRKPWIQLLPEACEQAIRLLSRMLMFQASERITAEEALHDEYFVPPENSEGYLSSSGSPVTTPTPTPPPNASSDSSCTLNSSVDSGIQDS